MNNDINNLEFLKLLENYNLYKLTIKFNYNK